MATTVEELLVRIDATTEKLRTELRRGDNDLATFERKVETRLSGIETNFKGVGSAITSVTRLLGPLGIAISGAGLLSMARDATRLANDLSDTAAQLGVTTEFIQAMRFAARESGVQAEVFENALLKLNVTLGDAIAGDKQAIAHFERLGISLRKADGSAISTEEAMSALADVVQRSVDPATRAAAAAELLGNKMGPRLVPLLAQGAEGLAQWLNRATNAGQVMSDETIKKLAAAEIAIQNFQNFIKIKTGEILVAIPETVQAGIAAASEAQIGPLKRIIDRTVQELDQAVAAGNEELAEVARTRLTELRATLLTLQERAGVQAPQGHAGRNFPVTVKPAEESFTLPPPATDTGAVDQYARSIDDLKAKIAALKAEASGDEFQKLLVENFNRFNLELTDTSQKAQEVTELTRQQFAAMQELAIATEVVTAVRQADSAAVQEWTTLQEEGKRVAEEVQTPMEEYIARLERLNFLLTEGAIDQDIYNRAVVQAGVDLQEAENKALDFAGAARDLGSGLVNAFTSASNAATGFEGVLSSLLNTLSRVLENLAGIGLENIFTNLAADTPTAAIEPGGPGHILVGGGLQHGGHSRPGMPRWVGEAGPEIFEPNVPGTVVPLNKLGGGGVVVNQSISIQTSGGTPAQNQDNANKIASALDSVMTTKIESVLALHMRDRGMFKPNVV